MLDPTPAQRLTQLADRHGNRLSMMSRLIGRADGYLATFVRDGVPRRLADDDAEKLAQFFGVSAAQLKG